MATIEKRKRTKDGKTVYRVKIRKKGAEPLNATFERLTDARKWVQDRESDIRNQRHFGSNAAKRHTVGELIDRYVTHNLPQKGRMTQINQVQQLLWWKNQLGHKVLADINSATLAECRELLAKGDAKPRSNATVRRYLAVMSHAFSIAVKEWLWLKTNPMDHITRPKEPRGRIRYLDEDREGERTRLLKACKNSPNKQLYPIVVLALSTGARKNDLLELSWNQVDFRNKQIHFTETKNGDTVTVPLTGHALTVVKTLAANRRTDTNLVFPRHDGLKPIDIRKAWINALQRAGIDNFRFHDLRHSCASYLAMSGASPSEIAAVLGHRTLTMVKRYSHIGQQHTAKILSKMNQEIFLEA